jgi:cysteine desulfurase
MSRRIYLDHQAGTPVLPGVLAAMQPWFSTQCGNPASWHGLGLAAREAIAAAREPVAKLIGARLAEEIVFTSSGTEAINLAVKGAAWATVERGRHVVLSAVEHPAVMKAVEWLETMGFSATRVAVDARGRVAPEAVRAAVRDDTTLICVQHTNPDLGTVQPVAEIGAFAAERGVDFLVDATTSAGWLPVTAEAWGATFVALSPHRFYGPKGVGVLWRRRGTRLVPLLHGGEQESGSRAGTENVPALVGAGVAAELAARDLPQRAAHVTNLQRQLWKGIARAVPHVRFAGPSPGADRHPGHVGFCVEFSEGEGLVLMLDMAGVAMAGGPACVSRAQKVAPTLRAIGVPEELARGFLRGTPGVENTAEEMDRAVEALRVAVERLRGMSPAWEDFQAGRVKSLA